MLLQRRNLIFALFFLSVSAWTQVFIDIKGVGQSQIPIAITPFAQAGAIPQSIEAIVGADLARSGRFRVKNNGSVVGVVSSLDVAVWRTQGFDYLLTGSASITADSHYEIQFQLWDTVRAQTLVSESLQTSKADLRYAAHRIADKVYEAIIGAKGIFATRIAYVTKDSGTYQLWVNDADGQNAQVALTSSEAILSPVWSPQGDRLAYVSLESRKPVVYVHDVVSGKRRVVAGFKGSNSAPAWSPDGMELLVTLSQDGGSQLFRIPLQEGKPDRVLRSNSIDTEAFWAVDEFIYFVSDRGGAPQVYRMPATGGDAPQRLTFEGSYNVSPVVSPDGRWLAYISRKADEGFDLKLMELATGKTRDLADGISDGSPSFAPNSQSILYATRVGGKDVLMASTLDSGFNIPLSGIGGGIREPDWGPLRH